MAKEFWFGAKESTEKWEAEQTSKNGLSGLPASLAVLHFQGFKFIIVKCR